jgi:hypothetical protein
MYMAVKPIATTVAAGIDGPIRQLATSASTPAPRTTMSGSPYGVPNANVSQTPTAMTASTSAAAAANRPIRRQGRHLGRASGASDRLAPWIRLP